MRVICTGISGTDRLSWLRQAVEQARCRGFGRVALYDVRETMFEIARDVGEPVDEETVLDMFPRALVLLRAAALEKILSLIEANRQEHWILNTHAVFRWKNSLISGFDPHYLTRLDPHLFITVTAGVRATRERLGGHARWAGLTEEDVLVWREEEQFFTEEMARIHRKPQILVPRQTSVDSLVRLLFDDAARDAPCGTAYLSYPMQHVAPGGARGLDAFKRRLEEQVVVFDPADVNDLACEPTSGAPGGPPAVGGEEADRARSARTDTPSDGSAQLASLRDEEAVLRDRFQQHIADQIVVRDYKLVQQSDFVVVYYDAPVPSPGVISEMKFALESGKHVYGVWLPSGEPSVFFTRYCSTWFRGADALFAFLEHHAPLAGGPRPAAWPSVVTSASASS